MNNQPEKTTKPLPRRLRLIMWMACLWAIQPALGQVSMDYYLPDSLTYDPAIPTPEEVLGYVPGEWHVTHDQLLKYAEAVAAASDRATITEQARTHENRPTVLLTFTSPQNHQTLEEIRTEHLKLRNPDASGDLDTSDMPVVVWMGYSVHGNEPSGGNSSLLVMYHLAAAQGDYIEDLLAKAVLLVDPCFNPDGFQRFATWANMHKSHTLVTDPNSREFSEAWPGGRTNHYWFDLNRDWLPLQHPESRGRIANFQRWAPNILTDHHEMGTNSTFFFQPGIPSRRNPLTPKRNEELTAKIATFHGAALDRIGSSYYTRESFDDFYYGKGSTYPDVQGSVGILFEQASSRGHAQESVHGVVTFPFTIKNQFVTSLSTMEAAYHMRQELLDYQRAFYKEAKEEAAKDELKAYVFQHGQDLARTYHLVEMLIQHDIAVHPLKGRTTAGGKAFSEGLAYVVPLDQPQSRLIKGIFRTQTSFKDSLFYDISTWTMPLAMGLEYAELKGRGFDPGSLGDAITAVDFPAGERIGGSSEVGYVFGWEGYYAPRALYRLQKAGVRAKVASKPFTFQIKNGTEKGFSYGSIVVATGIQPDNITPEILNALMDEVAQTDGLQVYALDQGMSVDGADIGSPSFNMLEKPSVAILGGSGASPYELGEIWHLLDQRYHMPLSILPIENFSRIDLGRYNTLIMVNGNYGSVDKEKIKQWVSSGGTLIATKSATNWAAAHGLIGLSFKKKEGDDPTEMRPYANMRDDRGAQAIGGMILGAQLDITHPLCYGYANNEIAVFRNSSSFMELPKGAYAAPLRYTDQPLLSGYISKENLEMARNSAGIVVGSMGSGKVIAMSDNPAFRAFWYGTNKLLANGMFFGSTISSASTR